jgi:hypothetical protein
MHGTIALRGGGSGGKGRKQLNLTGSLSRPGGQVPHDLAGHCQRHEKKEGSTLGG